MEGTAADAGSDGVQESEWPSFAEHLARNLSISGSNFQSTLDAIVTAALDTVAPARYAGLVLVERGKLTPKVTLGEPPHTLDVLQQRLGTGPCIDSASTQTIVRIDDTLAEQRWPEFAARAVSLGVRSVLCVPLWVSDGVLGTLSLYGEQAFIFSDENASRVKLLATYAALALANSRDMNDLRTALVNRDLIGQAKGILMERLRITADAAFTLLSMSSQAKNRKLVDVAERLVETGQFED